MCERTFFPTQITLQFQLTTYFLWTSNIILFLNKSLYIHSQTSLTNTSVPHLLLNLTRINWLTAKGGYHLTNLHFWFWSDLSETNIKRSIILFYSKLLLLVITFRYYYWLKYIQDIYYSNERGDNDDRLNNNGMIRYV